MGVSISEAVIRLFEILKLFYTPEGLCWAELERGPIVFTLHFIGVGRGTGGFKFCGGERPFWNLENVFPPKGRLLADSSRGPIVFTYVLFCLRKRILDFQFAGGFLPFWDLENVLSPEGTLHSRAQRGPFWSFHFIVFEKGCLDLSIQMR